MIRTVHAVPVGSQLGARLRERNLGAVAVGTLVGVATLVSYLGLRLANIGGLPPFVDELIYASKAEALSNQPPLSLVWDGHGPSFFGAEYWVGHVIQPLVPAGRDLSVTSGLATLVLLFLVGRRLWNAWVGLTAAVLYTLSPFAITYDRMALVESFQASLMLGSLYLALLLGAERQIAFQVVLAAALTVILVAALLVKLNSTVVFGWLLLGLVVGGALSVAPSPRRHLHVNWISLSLAAMAAVFGWIAYRWQYRNPAYQSTVVEGLHFHARDALLHPLQTWVPRLGNFVLPTLIGYLTPPVLALFVVAAITLVVLVVQAARLRKWSDDLPGAVIAAGCAAGALAAPVFYVSIHFPRYFFTALPALMLLGAWFIFQVLSRVTANPAAIRWAPVAAAALSALALPYASALISDPAIAPIPDADRVQLVTGWPAGYGLSDMAAVIRTAERKSGGAALVAVVGQSPLWSAQLGLYMAMDHPPGDNVPPLPTLQYVHGDLLDVRSSLGIAPDTPLMALVEGGPDVQERWVAANPGFTLLHAYSGPGIHSFAAYGSGKFAT
jgi:4-amino-4-deoxy-L-arabinose transferase-like glycosyltransferase